MEFKIGDRIEIESLPPPGVKQRWRGLLPSGQAMQWPAEQRIPCEVAEVAEAPPTGPRKITLGILAEMQRERRLWRIAPVGSAPDAVDKAERERLAALEAEREAFAAHREALEKRAESSARAEAEADAAKAEAARLRAEIEDLRAKMDRPKGK